MGGFASSAVTVGRTLLGPALSAYGVYSDFQARRDAEDERHLVDRTAASADAEALRRQAEAEAAARTRLFEQAAAAERANAERWTAHEIEAAEREAELAEAQARAAAQSDQRRLEAEAAEAERLRETDLRRAQASLRARMGAAGVRGSTSSAALMTGMAQDAADRSAAAADRTGASVRDLWAQVEHQRQRDLLSLGQVRQRALLTMSELSDRQASQAAELAYENELALYRANSAANRLLADAWTQTRSASTRQGLAGVFAPLAGRLLSNL